MDRWINQPRRTGMSAFLSGLWTFLWVATAMVTVAFVGFLIARFYIAPHYLHPSVVRFNRPQPIRILTPEEAATVARDEPSHVWKDGVRESDIPKMENERRERRRSTTSEREKATTAPRPATQPDTTVTPETSPSTDTPPTDAGAESAPPVDATAPPPSMPEETDIPND